MIAPGYNGPAKYAGPSEAQAEVVLLLDDDKPTHVVQVADILQISIGAVRKRLGALEYKRLVVAAPRDVMRHRWILTGAGLAYRERLAAQVTRDGAPA